MLRRFRTLASGVACTFILVSGLSAREEQGSTAPRTLPQLEGRSSLSCPVTLPPGRNERYGNDALATGLWPNGRIVFEPGGPGFVFEDGSLGMKSAWWRLRSGRLSITGKRLDGAAPPLRVDVGEGYRDIGFQPATLIFPTPGCWEVTGRLDEASLKFITLVEKIGDGPCSKDVVKTNEVVGSFETTTPEEQSINFKGSTRLAHAKGERSYVGGINGTSTAEYLIVYRPDRTATFVGYEEVRGSVKGLSGSFIIEHSGTIKNGIARSTWAIVPSSGVGALSEIAGQGSFSSGKDSRACYSLLYSGL